MNLKCDPDEALFLRDTFAAVIPGYHMNKTHWNTVHARRFDSARRNRTDDRSFLWDSS